MASGDDISGGTKNLKLEQKAWIIKRNKCTSEKCLIDAYQSRIDEVCDIPMITGMHPNCIESEDIK